MEENQHLLIVLVFAFLFAAFDVLVREGLKKPSHRIRPLGGTPPPQPVYRRKNYPPFTNGQTELKKISAQNRFFY